MAITYKHTSSGGGLYIVLEIRLPWENLPSYNTALGFEFNEAEGYIENISFYSFDIDSSKIGSSGWFYLSNLV